MPRYTLGIDSSTQSCSGVVLDLDENKIVIEASVNYGKDLPQYNAPHGFIPESAVSGEVHSDPCMWLDALDVLFQKLCSSPDCNLAHVCAISGAGQQHGSVYLKKDWCNALKNLNTENNLSNQLKSFFSRSTSPIWMDSSTSEECNEIAAAVGGNFTVCSKSGSQSTERFTGPQIRKFYKSEKSDYDQTDRIHLISSFLCSVLVGSDCPIDTGDGAGMNLVNVGTWDWDNELLEATAPQLRQKLPNVVPGRTQVGCLSDYFVKKYGFSAETKVAVFTGDNPSSLIGMGGSQPGKIVISLGTSDTFFAAISDSVDADPDGCGHLFGNPFGGSMSLQCFINGSLARESVRNRYGYSWGQFSAALGKTSPGNDGKMMVPFFRPECSPNISLKNGCPVLFGGNDDTAESFSNWNDADGAIRACIEGQFLNMKLCSSWMNLCPETIYLTGGASQNNEIAQVIADVFQAKTVRLSVTGSVALGGAIRAANVCMGLSQTDLESAFCQLDSSSIIEPQQGSKEVYDSLLAKYANKMTALKQLQQQQK